MNLDPLILLVDLLAVYRLTRLVTKDSLLDTPRHWLLQRWPSELTTFPENIVGEREMTDLGLIGQLPTGINVYLDEEGWKALEPRKWPELLECPYCASVWLAFAVVAMRVWWDWWPYPALGLALAGAVALVFAKVDND